MNRMEIMRKSILLLILIGSSCWNDLKSQATVTQVISDFGGFWSSSAGSVSSTAPNNSHNLLAFKKGSTIYSTGVDDGRLTANGITFVPQVFESFPVISVGSGGIIGVGGSYTVTVVNNPIYYLTDGTNGLDLGTAMFNWSGTNKYTVSSFNPAAIGDGIPDILIPQMGDPSAGSTDKFRFEDNSSAIVGSQVSIDFSSVSSVANQNWKFYTRATPPVVGAASAGNRALRLIAYDFSDLGITLANYSSVTTFVHQLSGSSDQGFVAYNKTSFTVLPVSLISFTAEKQNAEVMLSWATATEHNNHHFVVERSADAIHFEQIGIVGTKAVNGNSNSLIGYDFVDSSPLESFNYYRLKQTDISGQFEYSPICYAKFADEKQEADVYPNPASSWLTLQFSPDKSSKVLNEAGKLELVNSLGQVMYASVINNTKTLIDLQDFSAGVYFIHASFNGISLNKKLVIEK